MKAAGAGSLASLHLGTESAALSLTFPSAEQTHFSTRSHPACPQKCCGASFVAGENHHQQQRDEAPREKKNNTTKASRSLLLPEVISMLPGAQPPPPAALEQGRGSRGTHGCWLWAATSCTPARAAPAACAPGNWRKGAGAPGDGAGTSPRCSLLNDWLEARQTDLSIKM